MYIMPLTIQNNFVGATINAECGATVCRENGERVFINQCADRITPNLFLL